MKVGSVEKRGISLFSIRSDADWSVAVSVKDRNRGLSAKRQVVRAERRRASGEGALVS